jgi:ATPase subunit of ABC transporter with duplicated ATPase domains
MSFLVDLKNLSWSTPDGRPLLENITIAFGAGATGLVGRNGSGKSTLLRLIAGELEPASGAIARGGRIGVLRQQIGAAPGGTVAHLMGASEGLAVLARIERGEGNEDDFSRADWTLPDRLDAALDAMSLGGVAADRPVAALSGGQLTRLALAQLLFDAPDLVLLDEPTNNLDADGRAAVAELLARWKGGAVVASHDRALLGRMDRIVELSGLGARLYGGGWDLYAARKDEERAAAERQLDAAQRAVRQASREAQEARERQDRRDSRGKARREQGGAPKLLLDARQQRAERTAGRGANLSGRKQDAAGAALREAGGKVEPLTPLRLRMPEAGASGRSHVLSLEDAGWRAPDGRWVLRNVSLAVGGGERVAVAGPNGAGKTTLLRLASGALAPSEGAVRRLGPVAMLDQQVALLRDGETVLAGCRRLNPAMTDNEARALLARFLFRGEAAEKPVAMLSGGERLRAGLACVLGGGAPDLLILDEPTNHLDLDSVEVLEAALRDYAGALLLVSHDEVFLEAVGVERRILLRPCPSR